MDINLELKRQQMHLNTGKESREPFIIFLPFFPPPPPPFFFFFFFIIVILIEETALKEVIDHQEGGEGVEIRKILPRQTFHYIKNGTLPTFKHFLIWF